LIKSVIPFIKTKSKIIGVNIHNTNAIIPSMNTANTAKIPAIIKVNLIMAPIMRIIVFTINDESKLPILLSLSTILLHGENSVLNIVGMEKK